VNTKLTLNINNSVIRQAKLYAKLRKRSVSNLVEDYLYSISKNNEKGVQSTQLSPITSELLGMIKIDGDLDYKEILETALTEKYV
jgi:hypothetical protein